MGSDFEMAELEGHFARIAAESKRHTDECRAPECNRCDRHICRLCMVVIEHQGLCDPCATRAAQQRWSASALYTIPKGFTEATLDAEWLVGLVGAKVIADARAALTAPRVVCVGPPGSGKTSLAVAMFRAALFDPIRAQVPWTHRYVSSHSLAKARSLHSLGQGEAPLVQEALEASALVIDELGGEDLRYASAVAEILYERHADDRPTWVTTGVGPKEIADRYGGGIARRVFEDAAVFRLTGHTR